MAYRNKLTDIVAAYTGTDTAANTATGAAKGYMQFAGDGTAGENQILLINNGSGATITVEFLASLDVEGRYAVADNTITLAAGVERAISEFTRSTFGNLEDAATPADTTADWIYFNIYTGSKITAGGVITSTHEYVVLSGTVVIAGGAAAGTYTVGQSFTADATSVTDFAALSSGAVVARTAGASVKMKLLKRAA
jgi:hypothetical protein